MKGNKNIEILNYYTGQKLFDMIFADLGVNEYEDFSDIVLNGIFKIIN